MKIIFFGTPPFAAHVLSFLLKNHIDIVAIVTKKDKPKGRSGKPAFSAVKTWAKENAPSIPILQPEKASTQEFEKQLQSFKSDLFVVVAYGEIVEQNILDLPRLGCINLHSSLLPKYRGAAPIQFALLAGEKETGVTIIEMALKMDAGDILAQKKVPIPDDMTFEELEAKLCEVGCETLLETINSIGRGDVIKTPQNHSKATYVSKIDPLMGKIEWNDSAQNIHNKIRAFSPRPGAWCLVKIGGQNKRLKILRSQIQIKSKGSPGSILNYDPSEWVVACGTGAIKIIQVQLEGKKTMLASEFIRGANDISFT